MNDKKIYDGIYTIRKCNYLKCLEFLKDVQIITGTLIISDGIELELPNLEKVGGIKIYTKSKLIANNLNEVLGDIIMFRNSKLTVDKLETCYNITLFDSVLISNNLKSAICIKLLDGSNIIANNINVCSEILISSNKEMEEYFYNKFPNSKWYITYESTDYIINKCLTNATYNIADIELNKNLFIKVFHECEKYKNDETHLKKCNNNYVLIINKKLFTTFDKDFNIIYNSLNDNYEIYSKFKDGCFDFYIVTNKNNEYLIIDIFFIILMNFHNNKLDDIIYTQVNHTYRFGGADYVIKYEDLEAESKKIQNLKMFI